MTTTRWHELTMNPAAITHLYATPPSLRGSHITQVALHRDGPVMSVHALLADFPDTPPPRWTRDGYDAAAIQLDLIGAANVEIAGWSTDNVADIEIERLPDGRIRLRASAGPLRLSATCDALRIAHLTGYKRAP